LDTLLLQVEILALEDLETWPTTFSILEAPGDTPILDT